MSFRQLSHDSTSVCHTHTRISHKPRGLHTRPASHNDDDLHLLHDLDDQVGVEDRRRLHPLARRLRKK